MSYQIPTKYQDLFGNAQENAQKYQELSGSLSAYAQAAEQVKQLPTIAWTGLGQVLDNLYGVVDKYSSDPSKIVKGYIKHLKRAANSAKNIVYSGLKGVYRTTRAELNTAKVKCKKLTRSKGAIAPEQYQQQETALSNQMNELEGNLDKIQEYFSNDKYRPSIWRRVWNRFRGMF